VEAQMIAIDPGLRGSGVAVFNEQTKQLLKAKYVKNPAITDRGPACWVRMAQAINGWLEYDGSQQIIIEYQRLRIGREKGDPNNMMELQGVVGAISGLFYEWPPVAYFPEQWKGTIKKEVMTQRILNRLTPEELLVIGPLNSKSHNTIDAVGIGLYHLGRLKHERTINRS
jgi:hypothetical protein